uniref:Uncharacterized protein n=1 Tax=Strigamia maritima TaxID=126957 RepID=T1JDQ7_STRMM
MQKGITCIKHIDMFMLLYLSSLSHLFILLRFLLLCSYDMCINVNDPALQLIRVAVHLGRKKRENGTTETGGCFYSSVNFHCIHAYIIACVCVAHEHTTTLSSLKVFS